MCTVTHLVSSQDASTAFERRGQGAPSVRRDATCLFPEYQLESKALERNPARHATWLIVLTTSGGLPVSFMYWRTSEMFRGQLWSRAARDLFGHNQLGSLEDRYPDVTEPCS